MVRLQIFFLLILSFGSIVSNPMISKIMNNSDIGYVVTLHTDESSCTFHGKNIVINAHQIFEHSFLLERGTPSLMLRPAYYVDQVSGQKIDFLDEFNAYNQEKLNQAFNLWKTSKGKSWRKIKIAQQWLQHWIGGDIVVIPYDVQIFGYLLNWSRVTIKNNNKHQQAWLSFAKGIFARLLLEIDIIQDKNRPIQVKVRVLHGQGGLCVQGAVERI